MSHIGGGVVIEGEDDDDDETPPPMPESGSTQEFREALPAGEGAGTDDKTEQRAATPPLDAVADAVKERKKPRAKTVAKRTKKPKAAVIAEAPESSPAPPPPVSPRKEALDTQLYGSRKTATLGADDVVEIDEFGDVVERDAADETPADDVAAVEPVLADSPRATSPQVTPRQHHADPAAGGFFAGLKRRLRSSSSGASTQPAVDAADVTPPATDASDSVQRYTAAQRLVDKLATRPPTEVWAHYRPSPVINRYEQHRLDVGVKLKHNLEPPPRVPTGTTPPEAPLAKSPPRREKPPPIVYAAQEVKRVHRLEALRVAEAVGQSQLHVNERRAHAVMQVKSNVSAFSETINAMSMLAVAMAEGLPPLIAGAPLAAP